MSNGARSGGERGPRCGAVSRGRQQCIAREIVLSHAGDNPSCRGIDMRLRRVVALISLGRGADFVGA